jgi:hypothetical protein
VFTKVEDRPALVVQVSCLDELGQKIAHFLPKLEKGREEMRQWLSEAKELCIREQVGWGDFLKKHGIARTTAHRYMQEDEPAIVDSIGPNCSIVEQEPPPESEIEEKPDAPKPAPKPKSEKTLTKKQQEAKVQAEVRGILLEAWKVALRAGEQAVSKLRELLPHKNAANMVKHFEGELATIRHNIEVVSRSEEVVTCD